MWRKGGAVLARRHSLHTRSPIFMTAAMPGGDEYEEPPHAVTPTAREQ